MVSTDGTVVNDDICFKTQQPQCHMPTKSALTVTQCSTQKMTCYKHTVPIIMYLLSSSSNSVYLTYITYMTFHLFHKTRRSHSKSQQEIKKALGKNLPQAHKATAFHYNKNHKRSLTIKEQMGLNHITRPGFQRTWTRVRYYVVVRLSVGRLSVTFVHPTQATEIFGNVSTPFGTLATCDLSVKNLRRSSQGTPPLGVKPMWGSQM